MRPIPLGPVRRPDETENDIETEPARPRRRPPPRGPGRVRRAARYLFSPLGVWAGSRAILSSATFIGETFSEVWIASRRDPRFRFRPNGEFDVEATAFFVGVTVAEVERRFAARQRQTAYTAYVCVGLAVVSCVGWIGRVFSINPDGGAMMQIVYAFGFGVICVLAAFYQSLVNYQLRSRRAVGWREYLLAERGFWPLP